jgi:hemolysin activation/secretion protein
MINTKRCEPTRHLCCALKAVEMKFGTVNESHVMKILGLVVMIMTFANMQLANAAGAGAPDAGLILQQVQPSTAVVPSSITPKVTQKPEVSHPLAPSGETFFLQQIVVIGNTLIDAHTMHVLVDDAVGQRQSLAQLYELAARITGFYRAHGYPLSRAIIPEQTIQQGVLRIEVIEVRYGNIAQNNQSRVNDALLRDTTASLQSGQLIQESQLDRSLLLLSDIPGVVVNPTLSRGSMDSTSDLLLSITPTASVAGDVGVDNHGNSYTGQNNVRANLNVNNPLHFGDVFTVNALSAGTGMNYGRLAYESVINGWGTRVGGAASTLRYKLGGALANIDASGSANVTSLWAKQTLVRSRKNSVYAQLQVDHTQLQDHIDSGATPLHNDRQIQSATANVYGDFHDEFWRNSLTTWSLGSTHGRVQFDDAAAQANDMNTTHTAGSFTKFNFNLLRVENLSASNALHLSFNTQQTKNNLDSAQKMNAGGPYSVRAYAAGALTGDSGYFVSAELTHRLGVAWQSQWTSVFFMEAARLTANPNPSAAATSTSVLKGVGLGLQWDGPSQWHGTGYVARPVGTSPALADTNKYTRIALEVKKYF